MDAWKVVATFADSKQWVSPDIRSTPPGWGGQCFPQPIQRVEMVLPGSRRLILGGMEQFNFLIEALLPLSGGAPVPMAFHFLGKLPQGDVISKWTITPTSEVHEYVPWGKEYHGTPTSGWKTGLPLNTPTSILVKE